jgi:hypothetical protein
VVVALSAGSAWAGDQNPPPWRGTPGSTFQLWQFLSNTDVFPNVSNNPFGTGSIGPGSTGVEWQPGPLGTGVWCINPGGALYFTIPNVDRPMDPKELYYQIKYFSPGTEPSVTVNNPDGSTWGPGAITGTPTRDPLTGQWYNFSTRVNPFCPPSERICIGNPNPNEPIYIEQFVVDTRCIPSPAGACVLAGVGALGLVRRRR